MKRKYLKNNELYIQLVTICCQQVTLFAPGMLEYFLFSLRKCNIKKNHFTITCKNNYNTKIKYVNTVSKILQDFNEENNTKAYIISEKLSENTVKRRAEVSI